MNKYNLVNYFDVWGNKEEGFEVNNLCSEGTVFIGEDTNENVIEALKEFGFLNDKATTETVEIWNDGEMIEFYSNIDGEDKGTPIGRLELIEKVKPVASYGLSNTSSVNIWEIDEYADNVTASINDFNPENCGIFEADNEDGEKDEEGYIVTNSVFKIGELVIPLNECVKL